ncbi:hypothetical protein HUT19_42185 (plasmid) [Streptomyces sp. NA02950]|uniref:hypothetical protein n=1 Tax=Streptomyces sp. NA02950 TaxID=2742137 RepID=UPI00159131C2|nr:hypothetical protein [Streptomyces sp. NA02950]QKV98328.1 hypothetical protein HUT19_42185 [Streptomyces sp. NA02950]
MSAFTAEQIFAALYQALRPDAVNGRWERGYEWAMECVRKILVQYRLDGSPEHNLKVVEPAIREWLDAGPDYDSQAYNDGCAVGQQTIRSILDGDRDEILSQLQDAATTATRLYAQAQQVT